MTKLPPLSIWKTLPPCRPDVLQIVERTAMARGFTLAAMIERGRTEAITHARDAAFAACRDAGYSNAQIARRLKRDHSTVTDGAQRHWNRTAQRMAAE